MTEDFLHFIWKYGLFERTGMISDTGEEVQVIALGEHNTNAGPDFLNARVKIGHTMWAGNVEIHLYSSDWIAHKHHDDKTYDNVVLHAVHRHNQPITRSSGEIIPTIELQFDPALFENYRMLLSSRGRLPCQPKIKQMDPFFLDLWLSSLVVERLQQKAEFIDSLLAKYKNNWEEVFYIGLARSFGFGLNAIPFEMLAKSVSLLQLSRIRNSLFQVEAMLLGQAGFLNEAELFADYYSGLRQEYLHFRKKFGLKPVESHLWKFLRLRPVNFPTIRIAQLAALLIKSEGMFSQILNCREIAELWKFFDVRASSFWDTHYTFECSSPRRTKAIGTDSFHVLVINAVVPFLYVYGQRSGKENYKERALEWLNLLPGEKNRLVTRWESSGIDAGSAFYSQGLVQLSNNYCTRKRCLACSIGMNIITSG
jgi:hypothetical protein